MIYVLLYALAWIITFLMVVIKKRNYGLGGLVVCVYLISALFSIYFIQNISAFAVLNVNENKMHFAPFCFLFFNILLCAYPLIHFDEPLGTLKVDIQQSEHIFKQFTLLLSPFVIYAFVSLCIHDINLNTSALADIYADTSEGKSSFAGMSWLGKKCTVLMSYLSYIWPIAFFVCLSSENGKKLAVIPLLGVFCSFLISYATGARVGIFRSALYFFIVYLLFKSSLDVNTVKRLNIAILSAVGGIILLFALITISRFADTKDDVFSWISMYAGEGALRFSENAWDLSKTSNGDMCFSLIKQILGFDTFTDNNLRRDFYEVRLRIPTKIFYTYIGDWYIDLGLVPTVLLSCIMSYCIMRIIKNAIFRECFSLMQVLILAVLVQIIAFGFTYYSAKTYTVQLDLLRTFLVLWVLLAVGKRQGRENSEQDSCDLANEE